MKVMSENGVVRGTWNALWEDVSLWALNTVQEIMNSFQLHTKSMSGCRDGECGSKDDQY